MKKQNPFPTQCTTMRLLCITVSMPFHSPRSFRAQRRQGLPPQASRSQEERAWSFSSATRANLLGDNVFIHTGGLPLGGLSFSPRVCEARRSCPRTRPSSFEVSFTWTGLVPALMSQRSSICFLWTTSMVTPFYSPLFFHECPSLHKLRSLKWVGGDLSPPDTQKHQTRQGVTDSVWDLDLPSLDLELCFVDKSDN